MSNSSLKQMKLLVRHEWRSELRKPGVISGTALYLGASVFICFQAFVELSTVETWNALLWIILLFNSLYAASTGFASERKGLQLYFYFVSSPLAFFWARIIWTALFSILSGLVGTLLFSLFLGWPPETNIAAFLSLLFIGLIGLSITLAFIGTLAAKSGQGNRLTSLLALPLLVPLLVWLVNGTEQALYNLPSAWYSAGQIAALNLAVLLVASSLFPYLWRE
jgi:heme exporter protein B